MSYILDALRKSEQQRKLVRDLKLEHGPDAAAPPARRPAWPLALAALALLGTGIGAYLALQRPSPPPPAPAVAPAPGPEAAPAAIPEAASTPGVPPVPTVVPRRDPSGPIADLAEHARTAPTLPPAAPGTAAPPARTAPARVPFLRETPADFARTIPELSVNIHVYTPDPAQRVLYINNKLVREGEAVADGIYVEAIVADGVVLQRQGQRFKLPRPQ
jgi:general secretion pathway protein B